MFSECIAFGPHDVSPTGVDILLDRLRTLETVPSVDHVLEPLGA